MCVTWIDTCDWMHRLCQHQQFTFIAHVNRLLPQGYLTIGNQNFLQPMGPRNFLAMPITAIHGLAKPQVLNEKRRMALGTPKYWYHFWDPLGADISVNPGWFWKHGVKWNGMWPLLPYGRTGANPACYQKHEKPSQATLWRPVLLMTCQTDKKIKWSPVWQCPV